MFRLLLRLLRLTAHRRGRPWRDSLRRRALIVCTALRTNLTMREIGAIFGISKSRAHRIISSLTSNLAELFNERQELDRRSSWILDGTLVPTRDHSAAAKSKNYGWSCNIQVLARRRDLLVIAIEACGAGNRNDTVHYRSSTIAPICRTHGRVLADGGYRGIPELRTPVFVGNRIRRDRCWRMHRKQRARVEHALARLKDWRTLRDYRRRGATLVETVRAVALLHNLRVRELRDSS